MIKEKKFEISKIKYALLLIASILFVFLGVTLSDKDKMVGIITTIFFGICSIIFIIQLLPNSNYLKIHKNKLEIRSLYKSTFFLKNEITEFGIAEIPMIHIGYRYLNYKKKYVGFSLIDGHSSNTSLKEINKYISNYQAMLPDNYGYNSGELSEILNAWLNSSKKESI